MNAEPNTGPFERRATAKFRRTLTALTSALLCWALASCGGEDGGGGEADPGKAVRATVTVRIPTVAGEGTGAGGIAVTGPVTFSSDSDDSELGGCGGAVVEAGDSVPRRFGFDENGQDVWALDVSTTCKVMVTESNKMGTYTVTHGDFSATCEVDQSESGPLFINFHGGKSGCALGKNAFP